MEIDEGLPGSLVLGVKDSFGCRPVFCSKGFLFAGFVILHPINITPAKQSVSLSQHLVTSLEKSRIQRLGCTGRVVTVLLECNKRVAILLTFSADTCRLNNRQTCAAHTVKNGASCRIWSSQGSFLPIKCHILQANQANSIIAPSLHFHCISADIFADS